MNRRGEKKLSFLGNFLDTEIRETTLERDLLKNYVKKLFKRWDFPDQIFVALGNSTVVSKGDLVWANIDCEHPYDWLPMPRIDELVLNLPTKEAFLKALGADDLARVSPETESRYWDNFEFEFAPEAAGVRLIWE
jgi:hypothetical protein